MEYNDPDQKDIYKDGELWLIYSHSTAVYSASKPYYKHFFREAISPYHLHIKLENYFPYYDDMPKRYWKLSFL